MNYLKSRWNATEMGCSNMIGIRQYIINIVAQNNRPKMNHSALLPWQGPHGLHSPWSPTGKLLPSWQFLIWPQKDSRSQGQRREKVCSKMLIYLKRVACVWITITSSPTTVTADNCLGDAHVSSYSICPNLWIALQLPLLSERFQNLSW